MTSGDDKPYSQMTQAERTADRIAKNRRIDESILSGKGGLSLAGIVDKLSAAKQRATYGAVAELVGVLPRGLMTGRTKNARYSWVVAGTNEAGARDGWPTGYTLNQMDPECVAQIRAGSGNVIRSGQELRKWLDSQTPEPSA